MAGLRGKTVVVTGASSGIGAAVARGFGAAVATVIVHYHRNSAGARSAVNDIEAAGGLARMIGGDLTAPGGVDSLVNATEIQVGPIDVLVNNAGDLGRRTPLTDVTDEQFEHIVDLNLGTVFRACRRVLPGMIERGGGAIVNISSIAARTGGGGNSVVYAATKASVSTFTRGLAREVGHTGIRVNAVAPGVIDTPFHDRHSTPARLAEIAGSNPLKRVGTPQDCVGPVMFLASDAMSGYVTGQVIEVNGGSLTP